MKELEIRELEAISGGYDIRDYLPGGSYWTDYWRKHLFPFL